MAYSPSLCNDWSANAGDVMQAPPASIPGRWRAGRPRTAPGRRGRTLCPTWASSSPCGPAPPTPIQAPCGLSKGPGRGTLG